jgi:hypothetical protein
MDRCLILEINHPRLQHIRSFEQVYLDSLEVAFQLARSAERKARRHARVPAVESIRDRRVEIHRIRIGEKTERIGATYIPVRFGRGLLAWPTPDLLAQIVARVVSSRNEIRVVNLSKDFIYVNLAGPSELETQFRNADSRQVVVTGAVNERGTVETTRWARRFPNVVIVGALNASGTDFFIRDAATGTATGPGVDLYAPGENLTLVTS